MAAKRWTKPMKINQEPSIRILAKKSWEWFDEIGNTIFHKWVVLAQIARNDIEKSPGKLQKQCKKRYRSELRKKSKFLLTVSIVTLYFIQLVILIWMYYIMYTVEYVGFFPHLMNHKGASSMFESYFRHVFAHCGSTPQPICPKIDRKSAFINIYLHVKFQLHRIKTLPTIVHTSCLEVIPPSSVLWPICMKHQNMHFYIELYLHTEFQHNPIFTNHSQNFCFSP